MSELQVDASFETGFSPQAIMEIHPLFDTDACEWVIDVGEETFTAPTLHMLKKLLPGVEIKDYFPDGFTAERIGFLTASGRLGWYPTHQLPTSTKEVIRKAKERDERREFEKIQAEEVRKRIAQSEPKKQTRIDDDLMLDLFMLGQTVKQIAANMGFSVDAIQRHVSRAKKAKDPRTILRHKQPRLPSAYPRHDWTDEDDIKLRQLARQGLSSYEISSVFGISRNAIIGRCGRQSIQLHGVPGLKRGPPL